MAVPCKLKEPKTLKESLQFFGKLSEVPVLRSLVLGKLENSLTEFFHKSALSTFTSNSYGEILQTLLSANDVLYNIYPINTPSTTIYGDYNSLEDSDSTEHVTNIIKYIESCLPNVYASLYFLYFNVIKGDVSGSGQWRDHKINEVNDLYKWLIGQGKSTPEILPGGFSVELKSSTATGQILGSILERAFGVTSRGNFQNSMLVMMFLGGWHNSKTAHGCLFLKAFCEKVQANTFQHRFNELKLNGTYETLKQVCENLEDNLDELIRFEYISPVYWNASIPYSSYIIADRLLNYVSWLRNNLEGLKKSLEQMISESANWVKDMLYDPTSTGPFKYGFVFKDNWNTDWNACQSNLTILIDNLTKASGVGLDTGFQSGTLDKLKKHLESLVSTGGNGQVTNNREQSEATTSAESSSTGIGVTSQSNPCDTRPPTTLKGCLQFLARLYKLPDLMSKLLECLRSRLKAYCITRSGYNSAYLANFADVANGYFYSIFQYVFFFLRSILQCIDEASMFGEYRNICTFDHERCLGKCIDILESSLPQVGAALCFLYYKVCSDCGGREAGQWNNQRLRPTDTNNKELQNWLTAQTSTSYLMPGGFQNDDLHSTSSGLTVALKLKGLVDHTKGGHLQHVLVGMLFLCPWQHSLSAHAILFLQNLCITVAVADLEPKLRHLNLIGTYDDIKSICGQLRKNLEPFVKGSSGIQTICQRNDRLYSTLWDPDVTNNYVSWLKENLNNIQSSLNQMFSDCSNWVVTMLKDAKSAGPFKYGFIFKDATWEEGSIESKLKNDIKALIGSIQCLFIALLHPSQTLKQSLQLWSRLHNLGDLKTKVIETLKTQVDNYCGSYYLKQFGDTTNGYLAKTFEYADGLLRKILQKVDHGIYSALQDIHHKDCICISHIATIIIGMLSHVFTALYFLYFNVCSCGIQGSSKWVNLGISDSSGNLCKFLTDHYNTGTLGLIDRGFQDEHFKSNTTGSNLTEHVEKMVDRIYGGYIGPALAPLLLVGPWHHSKLGHAMLFLGGFCREVDVTFKSQLEGRYENHSGLKEVCTNLKKNLDKFVSGSDTILLAVCQMNASLYGSVWDASKFGDYINWLKLNLGNIKGSLELMSLFISSWNKEDLMDASTAGPFRFGFVFMSGWDGKSVSIGTKLNDVIKQITDGSNSLNTLLEKVEQLKLKEGGQFQKRGSEEQGEKGAIAAPVTVQEPLSSDVSTNVSTSSSDKTTKSFCSFTEPRTVLESLQLLTKLHTLPSSKESLGKRLQSELGPYCALDYLHRFSFEKPPHSEISAYFSKSLQDVGFLLAFMVGPVNICGSYECLQDSVESDETYADAVIARLPQTCAALLLLYFNTQSSLNRSISGGTWSAQELSGSSSELNRWLTDKIAKHPGGFTSMLMPRGFEGKINRTQGLTGVVIASQIEPLLNNGEGGSLQNILAPLLFLGPWCDPKLGYAILFLKALCDNIALSQDYSNDDQGTTDGVDEISEHDTTETTEEEDPDVDFEPAFKERYPGFSYYTFQYKCAAVSTAIEPFTESAEFLCAVCEDGSNLYENLLKQDALEVYLEWLGQNFHGIIASLQSMSTDCLSWNIEDIQVGECDGPFPYGFVFVGDTWQTGIKGSLPEQISELIRSLNAMLEFFHQGSQLSAIVGTVGGTVVGAAGLGAAYAYNLWGFGSLVQSVLTPLL